MCKMALFQMFKLFDEDGNGNISIQELLSMMAFFIEVITSEFLKQDEVFLVTSLRRSRQRDKKSQETAERLLREQIKD